MKKFGWFLSLIVVLLLGVSACSTANNGESPATTPVPTVATEMPVELVGVTTLVPSGRTIQYTTLMEGDVWILFDGAGVSDGVRYWYTGDTQYVTDMGCSYPVVKINDPKPDYEEEVAIDVTEPRDCERVELKLNVPTVIGGYTFTNNGLGVEYNGETWSYPLQTNMPQLQCVKHDVDFTVTGKNVLLVCLSEQSEVSGYVYYEPKYTK